MVVMCFNNIKKYLEQAKVSLKSIKINSPNTAVVLYLVNFNKNEFNDSYIKKYIKLDNIKKITAYSLVAMYEVLKIYKRPILWLDVDTIIQGDLSKIFDDVTPNTLKILKRTGTDIDSVFNTGVVAVGYSEITLKMLNFASKNAINNPSWFADQYYLYKAYTKYKNEINLINLKHQVKWHDIGGLPNSFNNESIIWHCKNNHFNESPYKEEYNYYKELR